MLSLTYYKLKAIGASFAKIALMILLCCASFILVNYVLTHSDTVGLSIALVDNDRTDLSSQFTQRLASSDGVQIYKVSQKKAQTMLDTGRIDGLVVIDEGFEKAIIDCAQPPLSFTASFSSQAGRTATEIVSSITLSLQSKYESIARLKADGLWDDQSSQLFENKYSSGMSQMTDVINRTWSTEQNTTGDKPTFGETYTSYSGIVALMLMMCILSFSSWLGDEASEFVRARCRSYSNGALISLASDFLAVFTYGLIFVVCALVCKGDCSVLEIVSYVAYAFCITGLTLAFRRANVSGGSNILLVFLVVFTALVGGCFINYSVLGGVCKYLPLITPQGNLIAAVNGSIGSNIILVAFGVIFALIGI